MARSKFLKFIMPVKHKMLLIVIVLIIVVYFVDEYFRYIKIYSSKLVYIFLVNCFVSLKIII